jgi:RHS repeat-associated protein
VLSYDRAGRIRTKGLSATATTAYAYTDPLKPDHAPSAVTAAGVATAFTYDANGNMLTGLGGKIMTYDGENRPLSVTHLGKRTCYVYGADGKRLKKVEGLPPTQDCTALPANTNATVTFGAVEVRNWLIAGAEQVLTYPQPAVKLLNGTTPAAATYLHRDALASVRAITSAAGAKIEAAVYKPFGEQSEWVLPGNAAPETKGWIGERYDTDAGLQYLNARYYDPELGMFLQPDWFEVTKAGVGTNRFSYSFNDPVNKIDPGGNCVWDACAVETAFAIGAIVASILATDAAVDIANGATVGDSPLGNPLGQALEAMEPDPWQESLPSDNTAGIPTVLGNPAGEPWPELYGETLPAAGPSGPIVLSDPIPDDQYGKIIQTTSDSFNAREFEKSLVGLPVGERVAEVRRQTSIIAEERGWTVAKDVQKKNPGRTVYRDPATGELYSVDTQHGRFEKLTSKGKHIEEVQLDGTPVEDSRDSSGGHDLEVR